MAFVTIPREELELVQRIGQGHFGTVFRAKWRMQEVAAKRLSQEERNKEAEFLSRLNHPNIVRFLGVADEHLDFFLILEFCEGGSLRSYLDEHRGQKLGLLFYDWATEVAKAIEYLKEKQVVHKDVKSPNLLITTGNILKLADFGLAKNIHITTSRATETASYPWMAPELLRDSKLSPSYDIYSYGVVCWELWTTDIPFEDCTVPENLVWRICREEERPLIPGDCPEPIATLLSKCWKSDWQQRPTIQYVLKVVSNNNYIWRAVRYPKKVDLKETVVSMSPHTYCYRCVFIWKGCAAIETKTIG